MEMKAKTHVRHSVRLEVTAPVESEDTTRRLTLNDKHWMEDRWERSGLPDFMWRRLHRIDVATASAAQIARLLTVDSTNADVVDNCSGVTYAPLDPYARGGLEDALMRLSQDAADDLDELLRVSRDFTFTAHRKEMQP